MGEEQWRFLGVSEDVDGGIHGHRFVTANVLGPIQVAIFATASLGRLVQYLFVAETKYGAASGYCLPIDEQQSALWMAAMGFSRSEEVAQCIYVAGSKWQDCCLALKGIFTSSQLACDKRGQGSGANAGLCNPSQ